MMVFIATVSNGTKNNAPIIAANMMNAMNINIDGQSISLWITDNIINVIAVRLW